MSKLQCQESFELTDFFTTRDPMLAATLGTLGFLARGEEPFSMVVNANRVIKLVDENWGTIDELVNTRLVFEMFVDHPHLGKIDCRAVELAHEFAKLSQRVERGDLSAGLQRKLDKAKNLCDARKVPYALSYLVKNLYDQITNVLVVSKVLMELADEPLLKFTRLLNDKGVAHAIQPLETEPQVMRRAEHLFDKGKLKK